MESPGLIDSSLEIPATKGKVCSIRRQVPEIGFSQELKPPELVLIQNTYQAPLLAGENMIHSLQ